MTIRFMTRAVGLCLTLCLMLTGTAYASAGNASRTSANVLERANASTLRTRLPAQYQGGLVVGVQINQPPSSFQTSAGQLEGYDPDIFRAMSKLIGVPITIKQVTFENLLLGLESGKFDLIADTNITAPREKIYNQLSEDNDHYTLVTKTGSQLIARTPLAMCGQTIASLTGDEVVGYLQNVASPQCKSAGKSPITQVAAS